MIFYLIIYLSFIALLIDLILNLIWCCMSKCCPEYEYYYNAGNGEQKVVISFCSKIKIIWEKANNGATEENWANVNKNRNNLFFCQQCRYNNPYSFLEFINKFAKKKIKKKQRQKVFEKIKNDFNENNSINLSISKSKTLDRNSIMGHINKNIKIKNKNDISINTNIIAVNITTMDEQIHYPIPCYPDDLFSSVINKFYEQYPKYKNKECYFLGNGQILEPNLSVSKNGIKNGVSIIIILKVNEDQN